MENNSEALLHFLNPRSVAVVGVSPNWSYINTTLKQFKALKTPAAVYPINPNYPEVEGLKCYPRLTDVPDDLELVLLSVPAKLVPEALAQCEQKKVKAINIITSGFAEIGGEEGQRRHQLMADFISRTGIRIIGPNCFGNASSIFNFAGMFNTALMCQRRGKLSLAFQSGGLAIAVVANCIDRYIDIAHLVTTGNEVDLDLADCLDFFAGDESTRVIGLYVEQFRKPELFLKAARKCAEMNKPVIVLKSGRSEQGARMAQAHTGALAGSDRIIDAVLKKNGIIRVYNLNEMLETMALMHTRKLPQGPGVAALTNSGGENALIMDLAEEEGLKFPEFSPESTAIIRKELYDYISVSNPLDITGPGGLADHHVHRAALEGLGRDPNIHIILHQLGGNNKFDGGSPAGKLLLEAVEKYPDKIWLRTSKMAGNFREKPLDYPDFIDPRFEVEGVPIMMGLDNVLKAVKHLLNYTEFKTRESRETINKGLRVPEEAGEKARAIVKAARGSSLTEAEGKAVLALYGIPVTREALATNPLAAAEEARRIGFPVVLKIVSPQILHKTEAGGVALNIQNEEEARQAYETIMQKVSQVQPQAEIQGVSVQEMVRGGQEMVVGMSRDPQFGPGIIVGLGGIFVEVLKDIALDIPPLDQETARKMVESLRGKAILQGARGQKPADLKALIEILQRFSQLCEDLKDQVSEIDINPLVLLEEGRGARALDCLIVKA